MLSEQQIETYRRDGYLVIPRLIQGEQLGQLRALTDRIVAEARGIPQLKSTAANARGNSKATST